MHKQRTDELMKEVRETKAEMERKISEQKKGSQERTDQLRLELTDARLQVSELTRELKQCQEKYETLREGME
jgi:chromosome segregation ATPase